MRYSPKFYKDLLAPEGTTQYLYEEKYLKFAMFQGFSVGAVCARMEKREEDGKYNLYVMVINVLAAYRRRGVASQLLKYLTDTAAKDERVYQLVLHVQTSNEEAKEFYLANGFDDMGVVEDYYKNVEPTSAFLMQKKNEFVAPEAVSEASKE